MQGIKGGSKLNEEKRPVFGPCSLTQKKFLQDDSDVLIFGGGAGSGKSHMALMYSLSFINDPNFRAVYIRQTSTQLRQSGALWDEAQAMYKHFGARFKHQQMEVVFPSGAIIQFKTCGADRDLSNFDGGQYSLIVFDELQWHTQNQFMYLLSRLRSKANMKHKIIGTCNPLKTSFLLKFVEPYLDASGVPTKETHAKKRYFAQSNGDLIFGDTVEEIREKNPKVNPLSYTFIAATVRDNPVLMESRPDYVLRLENLKGVERLRLLEGSWYASEEASGYWKSSWVEIVDRPPLEKGVTRARGWDFAGTVESEANRDPDYTAGVKLSRDKFGTYYIEDVIRFRKRSGEVIDNLVRVSKEDGTNACTPVIPRDPGQAGKQFYSYVVRTLSENGVPSKPDPAVSTAGKVQRFLPFAALCESGNVKMVRGPWNKEYIDELESFDGGRKGHDDMVDATSTAFNHLAKQLQLPAFSIPEMSKVNPFKMG